MMIKKLIDYNKLLHSKELLNDSQHMAKLGSWSFDVQNNLLEWSDEIFHILEIDPDECEPNQKLFLSFIHPDDLLEVKEAFANSLINKNDCTITYRLLTHGEKLKYVMADVRITYRKDGSELYQGTLQDVTRFKQLEKKLKDYIALVDEHIITSSTDLSGNIIYASKAFCRISKYSESELLGQHHRIVRHSDMPKELYTQLWNTITNNQCWEGEIKNRAKDGSAYWVHADISPIWDDAGNKIAYTAIRQDITDKKRLEELVTRDYLTGLYNRLKIDEILAYEMTQAARYKTPLTILLLDIDHFKNVNDTYGHQMGDQVLKDVSQILQLLGRESDSIGRWGGEEFLIVLPKTNHEGALIVAEKIRIAIQNHILPAVGHTTASFGLSEQFEDDTVFTLIERVDHALYNAKANGRNKVVVGDK